MSYWYLPLGFLIGTIGTLVGAGGGFLLIPILLFLHPDVAPDQLTGISLAVVFLNTLSGSIAYARKGRIDWYAWRSFTWIAIPGAVLGAYATTLISRERFNILFGVFLLIMSVYLFFRRSTNHSLAADNSRFPTRTLVEKNGTVHVLGYSPILAQTISFVTGFISSLIGIGGGIIHVPAMVRLLRFPVHIATATSHAILAVTSLCGLIVHIIQGNMKGSWEPVMLLAPGLIVGAQLGAKLSEKLGGPTILRLLAVALFSVGLRLILR